MPKPTPEEQEAFGTDLAPDNVSFPGLLSTQRPVPIEKEAANIQRRNRRASKLNALTANPFSGDKDSTGTLDTPATHRGLIGF